MQTHLDGVNNRYLAGQVDLIVGIQVGQYLVHRSQELRIILQFIDREVGGEQGEVFRDDEVPGSGILLDSAAEDFQVLLRQGRLPVGSHGHQCQPLALLLKGYKVEWGDAALDVGNVLDPADGRFQGLQLAQVEELFTLYRHDQIIVGHVAAVLLDEPQGLSILGRTSQTSGSSSTFRAK